MFLAPYGKVGHPIAFASSAPQSRARSSSPSRSGPYVPVTIKRLPLRHGRYPARSNPRTIPSGASGRPPDARLERSRAAVPLGQRVEPRAHRRVREIGRRRRLARVRAKVLPHLSDGRLKASTGAPATMRSAPAIAVADASAVESARTSGPMPSAMARAMAAVFPHRDSYTTTAFIALAFSSSPSQ